MIHNAVRQPPWAHLSEFVADRMGLHFPRERWDDLQRGLTAAAQELGFQDPGWLLSRVPTKAQLEVLASHLTIGETYFFRDRQAMQALGQTILPELIRSRRGRAQQLRIWSAGCCSGEEPYSMAILLHQALPDLRDWQVSITATDINPRFLQKAATGVYGEWSFRDVPEGLRECYFKRTPDGRFAIDPQIKEMVNFSQLNLAHDAFPSLARDSGPIDIVLCRNVLMYFTPAQIRKVIGRLHQAVAEGGWLVVSPSEASQSLFRQFVPVNFPGAVFYQKRSTPGPARLETGWFALSPSARPAHGAERPPAAPADAEPNLPVPPAPAALARALANEGKLDDALTWCDRWIAADKLNPGAHYLRATVMLEQGDPEQARYSLQRAIYLQPDFVLAHFALGNLARLRNLQSEASKHFANTRDLLTRYQAGDLLPESEGLTAGNLALTLCSIEDGYP